MRMSRQRSVLQQVCSGRKSTAEASVDRNDRRPHLCSQDNESLIHLNTGMKTLGKVKVGKVEP